MANYWRTIDDGDWTDPIWECVSNPGLVGSPDGSDAIEVGHLVTVDAAPVVLGASGQLTILADARLTANQTLTAQYSSVGLYVYGTLLGNSVNIDSMLEVVGGYVEAAIECHSASYGRPGIAIKTGGIVVIPAGTYCEWESLGHIDQGGSLIVKGNLSQYSTFLLAGDLDVYDAADVGMDPAVTARIRAFGPLNITKSGGSTEWRGQYENYVSLRLNPAMPLAAATVVRQMRREALIRLGNSGGKIACTDVQPRRQPCLM